MAGKSTVLLPPPIIFSEILSCQKMDSLQLGVGGDPIGESIEMLID